MSENTPVFGSKADTGYSVRFIEIIYCSQQSKLKQIRHIILFIIMPRTSIEEYVFC